MTIDHFSTMVSRAAWRRRADEATNGYDHAVAVYGPTSGEAMAAWLNLRTARRSQRFASGARGAWR